MAWSVLAAGLPLPAGAGWVVLGLGAASAVLGAAFAFAQNDLKRLLAYCSVENMGVILIGLGVGLLGAANGDTLWGRVAMAGALLHVWNHGLFKCLLFFGAGSVLHATGTREISRDGRPVARDAVDGGLVRFRFRRDFRAAAAERIRERMAGLSGACSTPPWAIRR